MSLAFSCSRKDGTAGCECDRSSDTSGFIDTRPMAASSTTEGTAEDEWIAFLVRPRVECPSETGARAVDSAVSRSGWINDSSITTDVVRGAVKDGSCRAGSM